MAAARAARRRQARMADHDPWLNMHESGFGYLDWDSPAE